MTLPLIEIFFSLILLLLWFFLVNLRERYLDLNLKGWGEMSLGVFFIFLGSLLELGQNIPELQKYLFAGDMPWGDFSKIAFYVIGIVLISFSPISWLPSILENKDEFRKISEKSTKLSSFLSELNKSASQVETKKSFSYLLNSALTYMCAELKTESGAVFLFLEDSESELTLTYFQGLSLETVDNFMRTKSSDIEIFSRCIKDKRIVTAGEILNSDRKLALAVKEDGFESCICIPLFSEEGDLGVIALFSKSKYHFENPESESLLELAMALGRKIQQLRKIQSLEQREKELKSSREKEKFVKLIAEDLVKGDPEEVLCRIVKAGSEIFNPCDCKIYHLEGEYLFLKAASRSEISNSEIPLSRYNWIKDTIEAKELKYFSEEQYPELKERGVKKILAVPLEAAGKSSGVIIFECKNKMEIFSPSENDFAITLASYAMKALETTSLTKALEHKENLIKSFLDSIEDRITVHDKNQRIIRINRAGLKLLNLAEGEVLGRSCFEVLYQQDRPEACPCYLSFKEKKSRFQQIKLFKAESNREGILKVWTHPLLDDKGEVEMVVEYAKFEEVPEIVSEIESGKKEVPKVFFNNLNNILAGILGNAELITLQLKKHKDYDTSMISEQMNLIVELVIEGSKLIRETKGEIEKVPEKKIVSEKEIKVEKEKTIDETLKILAIDDQKIILDLLESILQGLGHSIKVAPSGKDGLELFQRDGYDLVITDLGMPDMSGWEVSRRVKEMKKETPVVMITGWGVNFELDKIKEFGVDYLLSKPFKVEQLSKLIDQIKVEKIKGREGKP